MTTAGIGAAALLAAVSVLLWPLRANGVTGSAIAPRYSRFVGFFAYEVLPRHPTAAQFRRAGVQLPQDVVAHRRDLAVGLAAGGAGLVLAGGVLVVVARRRRFQ